VEQFTYILTEDRNIWKQYSKNLTQETVTVYPAERHLKNNPKMVIIPFDKIVIANENLQVILAKRKILSASDPILVGLDIGILENNDEANVSFQELGLIEVQKEIDLELNKNTSYLRNSLPDDDSYPLIPGLKDSVMVGYQESFIGEL